MTKEDIIRMAREAEGTPYVNRHYPGLTSFGFSETTLEAFAALVAKHERKACAQIVDDFGDEWMCDSHMLSKTIRARGNT
jgi:hypothetical protein